MNLLRGLPNLRTVLAWGCFDLANQSFTLLINTLLFGIFVGEVVMGGGAGADFAWSLMGSISLAIVAATGPALGALADAYGWKKRFLIASGVVCVALTATLAALPGAASVGATTALAVAFLVYIPANIAFNFSENFLSSFLPEIATRETMGKVSSIGWAMGYLGALILLVLLVVPTQLLGLEEPADWRPLFVFAAAWFAVMMIPTIRLLPEAPPVSAPPSRPVREAFRRLRRTAREAARFRDLATLLGSYFIYGMGMQVVIFFAGRIARADFGFEAGELVVFTGVITVFAGASALSTGLWQDHIGHKTTLGSFLALWTIVAAGLALTSYLRNAAADPAAFPAWPIWVVGIGVGVGLGGLGTATRASVGVLTPTPRTAEFFSLWGTTAKLAGVIGLPIFGAIRSQIGSVPSLAVLASFFLIGGLCVIRFVDMRRGERVAIEADAD